MKIHNILLLFCSAVLLLSSCTITQQTIRTTEIEANVKQYPCFADLDVKEGKVEKSIAWNWSFNEQSLSNTKENLIADLLKENGGDVLLEPRFTFRKEMFGARELSVSGFSANFRNFRNATEQDLKAYEILYGKKQINYIVESQSVFALQDSLKKQEPKKKIVPRNSALPKGAKAFYAGFGWGGVNDVTSLNHWDDCHGASVHLGLDYGLCNLIKGDASISGGAYIKLGLGSSQEYNTYYEDYNLKCGIWCGGLRSAFHYSWMPQIDIYLGCYIEGGQQYHWFPDDDPYLSYDERDYLSKRTYGNWGPYYGVKYRIGQIGFYYELTLSDFSINQIGVSYNF